MSSTARITEIDISRPARALRILRWSDILLVVGCGQSAFALGMQSVGTLGNGHYANCLMAGVDGHAPRRRCLHRLQHVGRDSSARVVLIPVIFPLLALVSMVFVFVVGAQISRGGPVSGADSR